MRDQLRHETYPVYLLEFDKEETSLKTVDDILSAFRSRIEADDLARYIAIYDHFGHTKSLAEGQIAEGILDAKSIVFCFGITLPDPQIMAVRPRSIGVVETRRGFIVTFMEAPMPVANTAMESWARSLVDRSTELAESVDG